MTTSPIMSNLAVAEAAAEQFAAAFPGHVASPALQRMSEGAYLYVEAHDLTSVCVRFTHAVSRAREARQLIASWVEGVAA